MLEEIIILLLAIVVAFLGLFIGWLFYFIADKLKEAKK